MISNKADESLHCLKNEVHLSGVRDIQMIRIHRKSTEHKRILVLHQKSPYMLSSIDFRYSALLYNVH